MDACMSVREYPVKINRIVLHNFGQIEICHKNKRLNETLKYSNIPK